MDRYLSPSDLLEDAANAVRYVQDGGPLSSVDKARRDAILAFGTVLDKHFHEVSTSGDTQYLVERDPHWHAIRNAAMSCLEQIGFSPAEIDAAALE
ncbi:MAG: hypothetical protein KDA63_10720 [Planctomycetales bacterium]|nr:hypothetical protein [Planctomycetales bacterium]